MALVGNPQGVDSTSLAWGGGMSPETAVQEQALNRRRLIANMLMQQGLQPKQGRMAGRFYVAANPLEHVAGLAQAGMGAFLTHDIDSKQKDLIAADTKGAQDFIKGFEGKRKQISDAMLAQAMPQPPAPPPQAPPQQPYSGEVGAMAQPDMAPAPPNPEAFRGIAPGQPDKHTGVSNFQARPDTLGSGIQPGGLDPHTITPADMSQFAPHPEEANQPPAVPAPAPPPQPAPAPVPQARQQSISDLSELLTHQHPMVREYGRMLAQQMMSEREHDRNQGNLDRAYGLDERKLTATTDATKAMREDTNFWKGATLEQQRELTKATQGIAQQNADTTRAHNLATENAAREAVGLNKAQLGETVRHNKASEAALLTKQKQRGSLPAQALKMKGEELDAIGAAAGIKSDMASIRQQIDSGKLKLGLMENLASEGRNTIGMSDENSRNYASFQASLERMRNESLRLNKGVQTEGDSVRAWNELIKNIRDPGVVKQRLAEIESLNDRAVNLRKMNIDVIHQNYGLDPMDTGGYEQQPATVGDNRGAAPAIGGGWSIRPIQ